MNPVAPHYPVGAEIKHLALAPTQWPGGRRWVAAAGSHLARRWWPCLDSEPRPQTVIDWLVWLALWPIVTVAWLVAVPFVLLYVAAGFVAEVLFGNRLRRRNDSDGPAPPG